MTLSPIKIKPRKSADYCLSEYSISTHENVAPKMLWELVMITGYVIGVPLLTMIASILIGGAS